jgi:diguanylate cyclase (GGDEF)-like protein
MTNNAKSAVTSEQAFEHTFRELSAQYAATLPSKVAEIETRLTGLSNSPVDLDAVGHVHRLVHSLNGSARTFGFGEVSGAARKIELLLAAHAKNRTMPVADELLHLAELLDTLKITVDTANGLAATGSVLHPIAESASSEDESPSVYLLETDINEAGQLQTQLARYGYEVNHFQTLDSLLAAMNERLPHVIVADTAAGNDSFAVCAQAAERANSPDDEPDLIFMSSDDSVQARLRAVRAGGSAYCLKPLRVTELVDRLDFLTERTSSEPGRVLIVEDEPIHAEYCARILESSSMMSQIVTDPDEILTAMNSFNPDLVIMDMYLQGCTGDEIASLIRQTEPYVSIPIVFLSVEDDLERQLRAMGHGGDEFLTKPITPSHLVSAVNTRVHRYRELRRLMMHDSLTGLVNHAHLQQQLELEAARTARTGRPLSFAMIDIDNFKQTNDRYGHPVGDRVLKNLARFLRQRLRKSDVVGRYGGEEFAIIMANTDCDNAFQVIQRLREEFASLETEADLDSFHVTFSAGVASIPERQNTRELLLAADRALYRAKAQGRNQVVQDVPKDGS